MGKIKLLNTNNNSYFENNQIDISDSIPTEGEYHVGDIIIKETQVEHMAIGWICIEAGNPGVWSEFGGMFDEPIELEPESVGMTELSSEVKSKLLLGENVGINVQLLQEAVNNFATKEELKNIDLSLYATKEDLNKIDLSGYVTTTALSATNNNVNTLFTITDGLSANIGKLSGLETTDQSSIVAAINEVFQSGNNVKQNLVDALVAKGVPNISTSNTWSEIIELISNPYFVYKEEKWYVEAVSGAQYGFALNSSGYYASQNKGVNSSYAICKLVIQNPLGKTVTMKYINYAEANFDYGIVSNLNQTLTSSTSADSTYLLNCKSSSSSSVQTLNLGVVDGFYYIKFIKDSSTHSNNDNFQFTITMS